MTASEQEANNEKKMSQTSDASDAFIVSMAPDIDSDAELLGVGIKTLIRPISKDTPEGENLRYEGTYDQIQESRKEDDRSLPVGVWERDLKKADWKQVKNLCVNALSTKTKDVQIAVWLTEALIHLHGFKGLAIGLKVIWSFLKEYWETIHPKIEDNDIEARLSPFYWMDEKVALSLKFVFLTNPDSNDAKKYKYVDWEAANALERIEAKDSSSAGKAENNGKPSLSKFLGSVMFTPLSYYQSHAEYLNEAGQLLIGMEGFFNEHCGREAPSLNNFKNTLEQIQTLLHQFIHQKKEEIKYSKEDMNFRDEEIDIQADDQPGKDQDDMKLVSLSIRSRSHAYKLLDEAADYLMINEPHSPTPYLIKRAVSWGGMPLTELLQELVNDDNDLKLIYNLLGLHNKDAA